jgi:hypothetical protein
VSGPPAPQSWTVVLELEPPGQATLEGLTIRPGRHPGLDLAGHSAPLAELVPAGWVLVDVGIVMVDPLHRARLYLCYDPTRVNTTATSRTHARWELVDHRFVPLEGGS